MPEVLLAIPNLSAGRSAAPAQLFGLTAAEAGATLLDSSCDGDHDRSVVTLAGRQGTLASSVVAGVEATLPLLDLADNRGVHPRVGAIDVAPIVHLDDSSRGAACAEALVLAHRLGEGLGIPVFLYGQLASGRTRSELRHGGPIGIAGRIASGELVPDFGPAIVDPKVGATLVAARPVLIAVNFLLEAGTPLLLAQSIAASIRESSPSGLPGVRSLGLELDSLGRVQVSCNLEDPDRLSIGDLIDAIEGRARVESGELIGLAPRRIITELMERIPMPGLDCDRRSIEGSLMFAGIS